MLQLRAYDDTVLRDLPDRGYFWLLLQIYAFDRSFEGAIAACGAPLVGILAEKLFGFKVTPLHMGCIPMLQSRHASRACSV